MPKTENQLLQHRDAIVRSLNARAEEMAGESRELLLLSALIGCGLGQITFGETENGDIGMWISDRREEDRYSDAAGDTATEALIDALSTLALKEGEVAWKG